MLAQVRLARRPVKVDPAPREVEDDGTGEMTDATFDERMRAKVSPLAQGLKPKPLLTPPDCARTHVYTTPVASLLPGINWCDQVSVSGLGNTLNLGSCHTNFFFIIPQCSCQCCVVIQTK